MDVDQPGNRQIKHLLALGDSYTIGESVPEKDRFPVQAVALLKKEGMSFEQPDIIAVTGWTTADLLMGIKNKTTQQTYDVVTLLIGVNNQYQGRSQAEYGLEFGLLLKQAIQLAGQQPAHVIVLSIPDYSVTPFAKDSDREKIAREINEFNAINRELALNSDVQYLDITGDSRQAESDPSLVASDGLHFSGKEYAVWASGLVEKVKGLWGNRQ